MLSSRPIQLLSDGMAHGFPAKTPKGATTKRAENDVGQRTVNGKAALLAKGGATPFAQGTIKRQGKDLSEGAGGSLMATTASGKPNILLSVLRPTARPLGDKTPFVNRNVQGGADGQDDLTPVPRKGGLERRPSSTRSRGKKSVGEGMNGGGLMLFRTPMNREIPFDMEGDMQMGPTLLQFQGDLDVAVKVDEEDYDEVEYCPPSIEVPYCPPIDFELPDYKQVGKTWWQLAHSYHYDDAPPPVIDDIDPASLNFGAAEIGNSLPAPSIDLDEDDPFYRKPSPPSSSTPAPAIKGKAPATKATLAPQSGASSRLAATVATTHKPGQPLAPSSKPSVSKPTRTTSKDTTASVRPAKKANPVTMSTPAVVSRPVKPPARLGGQASKVPSTAASSTRSVVPPPRIRKPSVAVAKQTSAAAAAPSGKAPLRVAPAGAGVQEKPRPRTATSFYRRPTSAVLGSGPAGGRGVAIAAAAATTKASAAGISRGVASSKPGGGAAPTLGARKKAEDEVDMLSGLLLGVDQEEEEFLFDV